MHTKYIYTRYICTVFLSLVVMPFVFWAVYTLHVSNGWQAFRFFQLHKTSSDFTLRHPTSERLRRGTLDLVLLLMYVHHTILCISFAHFTACTSSVNCRGSQTGDWQTTLFFFVYAKHKFISILQYEHYSAKKAGLCANSYSTTTNKHFTLDEKPLLDTPPCPPRGFIFLVNLIFQEGHTYKYARSKYC